MTHIFAAIDNPSPGVWVDGVEGAEFGEGPVVVPVPVLFAAPEDEGCFLFLLFYFENRDINDTDH